MQYLSKPRGKGYSLRMVTPDVLVGTTNPWTGKPFGREIKLGLDTRSHAEAVRLRDIRVGQVRQLEADALAGAGIKSVGRIIDLSPESAAEWRQARTEADDPDAVDFALTDQLDRAERAGKREEARAFAKMVFKGAIPVEKALEEYLVERREGNPYGFDPLALTTALNVRSTVKHLIAFMGGGDPLISDLTPDKVHEFRMRYLPVVVGLKPQTVAKHMTLLRGMWEWAITDKKYLRGRGEKAIKNPWIIEGRGTPRKKATKPQPEEKRKAYTADQVGKLLKGVPSWGSRQGDVLRLALVTGCRADEVGSLKLSQVRPDGSAFTIASGKSDNAVRFVPVVEDAQRLLARRVGEVEAKQQDIADGERRLFPEWPLKPSTNKANSLSQWFTRYRRKVLGVETDGSLVLHSFRHTWRTAARRAGVPEDRICELGGWGKKKGEQSAADVYDHGLLEEQLREEQLKVWEAFKAYGYLRDF